MCSIDDAPPKIELQFTSKDVIVETGVSYRQLVYWELKGIVEPIIVTLKSRHFKRYTQKHVDRIATVKDLIDKGWTLTAAINKTEWMKS